MITSWFGQHRLEQKSASVESVPYWLQATSDGPCSALCSSCPAIEDPWPCAHKHKALAKPLRGKKDNNFQNAIQ
eukprot:2432510-Amphidinium_carterae.1